MAAADESERKSTIREYYEALLIALVFVNFARTFVFQPFKIPSGSMEENLKVGDHLIVNKFIYGASVAGTGSVLPQRELQRGDVVVFRYPEDPELDYVKRIIGLPGETVQIRKKQVFIDGRKLDEPYARFNDARTYPGGPFLPEPYRSRDNFGPFVVPRGEYFAMGDNRDESNDSRFWGTVPRAFVRGRAFMVYWSFDMPPPREKSVRARAKELADVTRFFFTRTRWDRTFLLVDRAYGNQ